VTERPIHLFDANPLGLHLRSPVGYSLGRLLGSVNALVSELHQTDVRRHDIDPLANATNDCKNDTDVFVGARWKAVCPF
jgi:hypothetical protein